MRTFREWFTRPSLIQQQQDLVASSLQQLITVVQTQSQVLAEIAATQRAVLEGLRAEGPPQSHAADEEALLLSGLGDGWDEVRFSLADRES